MSTKTLALAAIEGRLVTCHFTGGEILVSGYVAGLDDYHVKIVSPNGKRVHLLHKSSTVITVSQDDEDLLTNQPEPNQAAVSAIAGPFAIAMEKQHGNRQNQETIES